MRNPLSPLVMLLSLAYFAVGVTLSVLSWLFDPAFWQLL